MRFLKWAFVLLSVGIFAGCGDDGLELAIDVKTDLIAGVEFHRLRLFVDEREEADQIYELGEFFLGATFTEGQRIIDLDGLTPGTHRVRVELFERDGTFVQERQVSVEMQADLAIVIVMTRDCSGAECPGDGSPQAVSCLGGRCVDPRCVTGYEDVCPEPECFEPEDCPAVAGCAFRLCSAGVCLRVGDAAQCEPGEYCDPTDGCLSAGGSRLANDGGMDAGLDATMDATMDAAPDVGAGCGQPCDLPEAPCAVGELVCEDGIERCEQVGFAEEGTLCRSRVEACDAEEFCDGRSALCPADIAATAGTSCRPAARECDVAESCDGESMLCPMDVFSPVGTACAAGFCGAGGECSDSCTPGAPCDIGPCHQGEIDCDSGAPRCVPVGPKPAGTDCRPPAGPCDIADQCDGVSTECPNMVQPATFVCRESAGVCDAVERCDGRSVACPVDRFAPRSLECRPSAGACDVAESCSGSSTACPSDRFASSAVSCRASAGVCDIAEMCTGGSADCPADDFAGGETLCRASAGPCDIAESCSGGSAACPADRFASAGVTCAAGTTECDTPDVCDGDSVDCPESFAAAGTMCTAASEGLCGSGSCDAAGTCGASAGICDAYLQFDGSDDMALITSDVAGTAFTLEAWVYVDPGGVGSSTGTSPTVFSMTDDSGSWFGGGIFANPGLVSFRRRESGGGWNSRNQQPFSAWRYFSMQWRTDDHLSTRFGDNTGGSASIGPLNATSVVVGTFGDIGPNLGGRIANVRLWNRMLTSGEIVAHRDGEDPPVDASGLVAWWPLDDGSGQTPRNLVAGSTATFTLGGDATAETSDPSWVP